ncbi:MAG: GNAT family N-acetyltransferase [Verrucomicrobiota bacterium]
MADADIQIQRGFSEEYRASAATLYEEAFGPKIALAIGSFEKRLAVIKGCLQPHYSFTAYLEKRLVGIVGFHTPSGSLTGCMDWPAIKKELGFLKAIKAVAVLALYDRDPVPGELVLDGISVDSGCRGRGIGSKLLNRIKTFAADESFSHVRLDVIDTNPRAKKLYAKVGFTETETKHYPVLSKFLGFSASTTLLFKLPAQS